MAKLTYQRRSGGGRYKGSTIPGDKKITEAEQRIINYLEKTRQQSKEVRKDALLSTEGVMKNEAENRQTLQNLKTDLWKAKKDNIRIRRDTEVKYYEDLARQAGDEARFWHEFSPQLGEDIMKVGQGLWDMVSYYRDKGVLEDAEEAAKERERQEKEREGEHSTDQCGRDYDDPEYGQPCDPDEPREEGETETVFEPDAEPPAETPEQLALKAHNTILKESQKEQIKLASQGKFTAADKMRQDTWGASVNTPLWGTYWTRHQASTFEEDWPSIVALANEGVPADQQGEDLIQASFQNWLKHKGIAPGSIGAKEVNRKFKRKLAAYATGRVQQELVQRDAQVSLRNADVLKAALDSNDSTSIGIALNQYIIHEAHAHKMVGSTYSAPASRLINYGTTFDSSVESIMKMYPFESYEDFQRKILSHKVLPLDPKLQNLPVDDPAYDKLLTWQKQRAHKESDYKDLFVKLRDKSIKFERANEQVKIKATIAELNLRLTDKNHPDYIDKNSKDGRDKLWSLMQNAESNEEKNFIGAILSYDPKSQVEMGTHEAMMNALVTGDQEEFLFYYNDLDDSQKKYYDASPKFKEYHELIKANYKYEDVKEFVLPRLKLKLAESYSIDTVRASIAKAETFAIQRFYDINAGLSIDDFPNPQARIDEIEKRLVEEINDEKGMFATASFNNNTEFKHFMPSYKGTEFELAPENQVTELKLGTTIDDINNISYISNIERSNLIKDIVNGVDGVRIPKILYDIHKKTGIPLIDIVNGQLARESDTKYIETKSDEAAINATQLDFLEQKAGKEVSQNTSNRDVAVKSGWYDLASYSASTGAKSQPLPIMLTSYLNNKGGSDLDQIGVPYGIINGETVFSNTEKAIRDGQQYGQLYDPWNNSWRSIS